MQCWYWESTEVEPADYALMLEIDGVQHDIRLSADDTREAVVEKLLDLAVEVESA